MMSDQTAWTEMIIPRKRRHLVGMFLLVGIVLGPSLLAVYNLAHWQAWIPSALWLALVGFGVGGFCKERGSKQAAIETLGNFALRQFVRSGPGANGADIQFGYEIFGKRFLYTTIRADRINDVHWSPGQGTHMAGRDMNDWSVVIWFDLPKTSASAAKARTGPRSGQDIYILGESGPKVEIAELGRAFIGFLRKTGVVLVPTDECNFIRPDPALKP